MIKETILHGLELLLEKLQLLFDRVWYVPQILRAMTQGHATTGDILAVVALVVLLVAAVLWIIRFFKAGFFRKLGMLASLALVIVSAALVLDILEDSDLPMPSVSLPPVLGVGQEDSTLPAEDPARTSETGRTNANTLRYSLARGAEDPVEARVYEMWRLTDDELAWQMDDDTVLQLSGLHSLPGGACAVEELVRYDDRAYISLKRLDGSTTADGRTFSELWLEITVYPNAKLRRQLWYAEAESYVSTGEQEGYSILRNDGTEVLFLQRSEDRKNENGDAVLGLSLGRQIGQDVVLVTARSYAWEEEDGHRSYTELNPGEDEDLKARLFALDRAVFEGRLRLVRGLSDSARAASLGSLLTDEPMADASGKGSFAIPCTRLLEMRRSEALGAIIRLVGPGPEGGEAVYSLVNGGALYTNVRMDRYFTWREAYEKGAAEPDETMSAFLGCPAVAADGGWVIDVGGFYSPTLDATLENYYFLSCELLTPPEPDPTPTPEPTAEGAAESETPQEETNGT